MPKPRVKLKKIKVVAKLHDPRHIFTGPLKRKKPLESLHQVAEHYSDMSPFQFMLHQEIARQAAGEKPSALYAHQRHPLKLDRAHPKEALLRFARLKHPIHVAHEILRDVHAGGKFGAFMGKLGSGLSSAASAVGSVAHSVGNAVVAGANKLKGWLGTAGNLVGQGASWVGSHASQIGSAVGTAAELAEGTVNILGATGVLTPQQVQQASLWTGMASAATQDFTGKVEEKVEDTKQQLQQGIGTLQGTVDTASQNLLAVPQMMHGYANTGHMMGQYGQHFMSPSPVYMHPYPMGYK